jgi:hypothetical protein
VFAVVRTGNPSDDVDEYWIRDVPSGLDRDRFGVDAMKSGNTKGWPWQVTVWAMARVRDIPLEKELRRAIAKALRAVPGVKAASEGDREFWIVRGSPSGEALVAAVAKVVDDYGAELRAYVR